MAHFAELDENNIVLRVTVVANEVLLDENGIEQESLGLKHLEHLGGRWVQTSYNNNFRGRYAGAGMFYDEEKDLFYFPDKPYPSWVLNLSNGTWNPPVTYPQDNKVYTWDESSLSWVEQN